MLADKDRIETEVIETEYIIAIGASAGGLEAINDLFDNIPDNTNFSFIVIQHLSPDHKSLMAELLSKHTSLKIFEANNNMQVEPNCIYLLPSKKTMTIRNNRLLLEEKKEHIPNYAIDIFLESLAKDKGSKAAAIILSGTGTDGTKGIQTIKEHGGLVIVQDPVTAGFNGMPNSAIGTGVVDLILPPEMIPYELIEYIIETPSQKALKTLSNEDDAILTDILQLLFEVTSYDFRHYKRPTINRRLLKRMSLRNFRTISDYYYHLKENEEEVRALCKEFLINVTRFFRDEEAFETLKTNVIPALFLKKKPGDSIKVWVVACSSGEEAYSIAILFEEYIRLHKKYDIAVKIFATDIDLEIINVASRGFYPPDIANDVSPDRLAQFFVQENNGYRISSSIRKMVVFAKHDVVKDPPYSRLDLLTCRNLLIYMNPSLQKSILQKFHFGINEDGYLFLGSSENIGSLKEVMREIDKKWKIYQCTKKTPLVTYEDFKNSSQKLPYIIAPNNRKAKNALNNIPEIFQDTLLDEFEYAGIFIDLNFDIKQAIGKFKDFISFPEGSFNFNLLKLVPTDLSVVLSTGLRRAIRDNDKVVLKKTKIKTGKIIRFINIIIKPYIDRDTYLQPFIFIVLQEDKDFQKKAASRRKTAKMPHSNEKIEELESELRTTKENLQAIIEELESTNEELQSSNEEIISANEELQSTNEELQSLNEELHTVNSEHQLKIRELSELNDDLNNYFRNTEIGQILIDRNLAIRKFTPVVTKQVNLIKSDLGRLITDISINFKNDFVGDIKQVIKTGVHIEREITMNDSKVFLMRIIPYIKQDKTTDGVVVNFINISEIKRLNSLIEGIFNSSASAIIACTAVRDSNNEISNFKVETANAASEKLFNISLNELKGKRLSEQLPLLAKSHFETLLRVVTSGETQHFEFHTSTTGLWLEVTVVKMTDGIILTFNNVTERKIAADLLAQRYEEVKITTNKLAATNKKLEQSNFDLLQFASVASHDLKEPLRKIEAFGNLLREKIKNKLDDHEGKYLEKIINSSGRMQTLIEDILTLSKLSNNNVPHIPVDLNEIIHNIVDDLEVTIKEKGASIHFDNLPIVIAIPGQMHQLFQNLITNALKFNNSESPLISVSCEKPKEELLKEYDINLDDFISIIVKDNGIGFEPQYSEKIFGIFQRLDGKKYEGTGIGLAICKKIVENHHGFIKAEGSKGNGSIFTIILPQKKSASDALTNKVSLMSV